MQKNLFVYGTLMEDQSSTMSHFLSINSRLIGPGHIPGRLFDLGNYPGAVYDPESRSVVHGRIFELNHPEKVLQQLDYYEGIGIGNPEETEYERIKKPVFVENGQLDCWIYLYQLPTEHLPEIESGDYSLSRGNNPVQNTLRDS